MQNKISKGAFEVKHENGVFYYWTSNMNDIEKWLRAASYEVESFQSFGWVSQIFYSLTKRHYERYRTTMMGINKFFRMIDQIERFFCEKNLCGENVQVVAYRNNILEQEFDNYHDQHEYRCNYYIRK